MTKPINTTSSGLVQVLLVDGSTLTVGPGSDLVIDKFVCDPKKKTSHMVVSFSKGLIRFIGGKISKNDEGVTVSVASLFASADAASMVVYNGNNEGRYAGGSCLVVQWTGESGSRYWRSPPRELRLVGRGRPSVASFSAQSTRNGGRS